jgi:hypothetical protein
MIGLIRADYARTRFEPREAHILYLDLKQNHSWTFDFNAIQNEEKLNERRGEIKERIELTLQTTESQSILKESKPVVPSIPYSNQLNQFLTCAKSSVPYPVYSIFPSTLRGTQSLTDLATPPPPSL